MNISNIFSASLWNEVLLTETFFSVVTSNLKSYMIIMWWGPQKGLYCACQMFVDVSLLLIQ